jgi:beta-galactosidase/beta-glucuronidase
MQIKKLEIQYFILAAALLLFIPLKLVAQSIPRPEHPRPQFERDDWKNLNGEWTYTFDLGKSGIDRDFKNSKGFNNKIIVPFCPESELSGVGYKDFIPAMWYQRTIKVPNSWKGKRVILHFGAVDYQSQLFIDGKSVGTHFGGSSSFSYDITRHITYDKPNNLVLYVVDDMSSCTQSRGKQSDKFKSYSCLYTRTTGIWQTVWMEAVAENGILDCHITPDLDNSRFIFQPKFYSIKRGLNFKVSLFDEGKLVSQQEVAAYDNSPVILPVKSPKVWSPENPYLYDVIYEVIENNKVIDKLSSYAGLRKIHIEGNKIYLNNQPIYLRFVLDQGYYPEGVWTAPSDEALIKDIELGLNAGFNGARLHQKVFEERYHYWADKLGYLTWGEAASWGGSSDNIIYGRNFLSEWEEIIVRDRNHPSIIGWAPFNENYWDKVENNLVQLNRLLTDVYNITKQLDPTRPLNNASGGYHVKTDLYTTHQYDSNPESFQEKQTIKEDNILWLYRKDPENIEYEGQPYLLDEIGGLGWIEGKTYADESWAYSDFKTKDELYDRLDSLMDVLVSFDYIAGYCYTQLTDVEQEQNGIYNYDRSEKFDMKIIEKIFSKEPAIYKK